MTKLAKRKQFVFEDNQPFASCHASTVVVLDNGDVLVAWFGGSREGANDVAIWCARQTNGGWSLPQKLAGQDGLPHWNPVLFQTGSGQLQLYYKVGHTIPHWYTMRITSDDRGENWSAPQRLVDGDIGGRGPVRNKPLYISSGALLAPASIETLQEWDAFVDLSYDEGATWTMSERVPLDHTAFPGKGIIQPAVWETAAGVHMLLRSTAGAIYRSDSTDQGKTWCPVYPTSLPNNNSGIDLVQMETGTLALVYNPVGQDRGARTPLVIRFSADQGETWHNEIVLEEGEGEYSYPAIVAAGNRLYVTYTWNRVRIVCWCITVDE